MRLAIAIVVLVGCRGEPPAPAIQADPGKPDASVDAPSEVAASTLVSLYGESAARLEGVAIEPLDPALLPGDQRASGKSPARIGLAEVEGARLLAVLGPKMGTTHMGDPLFAQAFKPIGKDAPLLVSSGSSLRWQLWRAEWYRAPLPDLLVLLDAAGAPTATRWLGPTLRVREVKLLSTPMFFVEELGNHSGVDDPITLTVVVYRENELRVANQYRLGPRSTGAECPKPSATTCVMHAPGSVDVAKTKPATLRVRVVDEDKCFSPGDALGGCDGTESLDAWHEALGKFVPGPPAKVKLVSAVR